MLAVGYVGLFLCFLVERFFLREINTGSPIHILQLTFGAFWIVGLIALVTLQFRHCRKERMNQPPQKMTSSDVLGLLSGTYNPNAELPKWIALPIKVFAWLVIGVFVLFMLVLLAGLTYSYFFSKPA